MKTLNKIGLLCLVAALAVGVSGCFSLRGLKKDLIIKHPDSPMLITEIKGWAKVSTYDAQENKMVVYGKIPLKSCCMEGWSFMKYDWQKFLKSKEDR